MNRERDGGAKVELRDVSKTFMARGNAAKTLALDNVSLAVKDGEFVCLLGPSGCGKSTILNLIAGFERSTTGAVLLDGVAVRRPGPERAVVFQEARLFPWLDVLENITFGPRMHGKGSSEYLPVARELIRRVGLEGFEHHKTFELSGGMKQRVALARAWIQSPELLLMDEPFAALDAQTRLMMQEQLVQLWEQTKITVVFVTHDVDEAILLGDRIVVMTSRPGRIKEDIKVPVERPRSYEQLIENRSALDLKQRVFHLVREETMKTMQTRVP